MLKYHQIPRILLILLSLSTTLFLNPTFAETPSSQPSMHYDQFKKRPKLLVMLVIDQFRADYLTRFESKFLPSQGRSGEVGGFQYLMSQGAYFPFGQYDLMQSITSPGHATVLTGAYPFQAGIPLNYWYSQSLKKMTYCVDDPSSPIVGRKILTPALGTETDGLSPRNLIASTVGDELKNAGYPSRVVSVALKDRAAILMGGHRADLAIWFDSKASQWVSSQHYLPSGKLPEWVNQLNQSELPPSGQLIEWKFQGSGTGYSDPKAIANLEYHSADKLGGAQFPHQARFGTEAAIASPFGVQLTEIAAEKALEAYQLGRNPKTDVLAVSFSSHDLVGHAFGPNSREMEEMTLAEDRAISKLLNAIRKKVPGGLRDVVVILTGDHGVAPSPEWAKDQGLQAGRIDEKALAQSISLSLNEKFGKPELGSWISTATALNFYINPDEIQKKKIDRTLFEAEAKSLMEADPRVAFAFTDADYKNKKLPPGIHERQILHSYYPGRSGEIILIPKPLYVPTGSTATHTSGYSYDRTVPIVISGMHIKKGVYSTRAEVVDIAPTLSFLSGTVPPSLSEGRVLSEILESGPKMD